MTFSGINFFFAKEEKKEDKLDHLKDVLLTKL